MDFLADAIIKTKNEELIFAFAYDVDNAPVDKLLNSISKEIHNKINLDTMTDKEKLEKLSKVFLSLLADYFKLSFNDLMSKYNRRN